MANQLNYPEPLPNTSLQRPNRVRNIDLELIESSNKQILFGTNDRDSVEVWIYNPDGSKAGHLLLHPNDTALSLTTLVDNTGPFELMNIDLQAVIDRLQLDPGRYSLVANFFRNEVGSEEGYKLFIHEISQDRMEVRLRPVRATNQVLSDIYEFIVPSVTRLAADAIISEVFNKSTDAQPGETITLEAFISNVNQVRTNTLQRILRSSAVIDVYNLFNTIMDRTYSRALDKMAADVYNQAIQQDELEKYIAVSFAEIIAEMIDRKEVSPLFQLA
jgi:hypothetical protein